MLNNMVVPRESTWISFLLRLAISVPFFSQLVRVDSGKISSERSSRTNANG
jgi:hypothetical protein